MICFNIPHDRILVVIEGDITELKVDAIVNPANSLMLMGGGVAGAIKRKGGEVIEREAVRSAPVPIGEAITTTAGRLPAKYVIHAPTMEKPAMKIDIANVKKATLASLNEASRIKAESIALPALGAGVGGLGVYESFKEMAKIIVSYEKRYPSKIVLVAWGSRAYEEAVKAVRDVLGEEGRECRVEV
ncbi:MAG: macro domain-containing protein [Desulfurococcales archaeon]|nr:macro domain-containing protein [Desulfurococcales archaeon]